LLALALIPSDNTAVIALISSAGLSEDEFVELMNTKAKNLGFKDTVFYDATGLSSANVSTAKEVSFLLKKL
jgi:D-alanyl-D-alanine carboxypeptidase